MPNIDKNHLKKTMLELTGADLAQAAIHEGFQS